MAYRTSFLKMTELVLSFGGNKANNLLSYLARPRCFIEGVAEKAVEHFRRRTPFTECHLGFAPQDSKIYKKRFQLLNHKNRAFQIAIKENPTVEELEEFSMIDPCWSILFPLKAMLHDHVELAQVYRGFLPFGRTVIAFFNSLDIKDPIKGTPTFKDHVDLQELSNKLADLYACSSIIVNNEMYLEGMKIKNLVFQESKDIWVEDK